MDKENRFNIKNPNSEEFGFFCNQLGTSSYKLQNQPMKKHEIHTIVEKAGLSSMKEKLTEKVEHFLNEKVNAGYEVISVSFTYYEGAELVAFITICR